MLPTLCAVKCNLTELTTKSTCVPLVVSSVNTYVHMSEFHVLVDCSVVYIHSPVKMFLSSRQAGYSNRQLSQQPRPEYKSDKCEVSGRYFVVGS